MKDKLDVSFTTDREGDVLTPRGVYAAIIMSGFINTKVPFNSLEDLSKTSIEYADALIKEFNK